MCLILCTPFIFETYRISSEKFIDLLADYGIDDISFKDCLGHDKDLDAAILYYLDLDADVDDYDEYEDE